MSDPAPDSAAPVTMALVQAAIREALAADRAVQQPSLPAPSQASHPALSLSSDSEEGHNAQKRVWKNASTPPLPPLDQPKRARRHARAASVQPPTYASPSGELYDGPSSEPDLYDSQDEHLNNFLALDEGNDPGEGPSHAVHPKSLNIPHPTGGTMFDPRLIRHPRSGEWFPPDHIAKFLTLWARNPLDREVRNRLRAECPRPTVPGKVMCTPEFDPFMTTYLTKSGRDPRRGIDKALKASQDKLLDVFGPLTHLFVLVDQAIIDKTPLDPLILSDWIQRAVCLLGNANASLSAERRKAALLRMDPRLLDLANKELGAHADGRLFGDTFISELRKHASSYTSLSKLESQLKRVFQHPRVFARAGSYRGRPASRPYQSSSRNSPSFPSFLPSTFPARGGPRGRGPARRGRGTFHPGKLSVVTPSFGPPSHSGQTRQLFPVLATNFIRPMGVASRKWASDRICLGPNAIGRALTTFSSRTRWQGHSDRTCFPSSQGCYSARFQRPRFPQHCLPRAQDLRRQTFGPQFAGPQCLCGLQTFQDGGHSHAQRHAVRPRLVHAARPIRCLPDGPHPQRLSPLPTLPLGYTDLAVYLPPIRPELGPLGLHKAHEAGHCVFPRPWGSFPYLPGRHPSLSRESACPAYSDGVGRFLAYSSGLCDQSQEIGSRPVPASDLPGFRDRFRGFHPKTPSFKGGIHQEGAQTPVILLSRPSPPLSSSGWPPLRLHPGNLPWASTLQGDAAPESVSPPPFPVVRSASSLNCRGQDGDGLVAPPYGCLERLRHFWLSSRFCDGIRCQPVGLGGSLRQPNDGRSLVLSGASFSHQLPGTFGGFFRDSQFFQVLVQLLHFVKDGQCLGGSLHQPPWGGSLCDPLSLGEGSSPFLLSERDHLTGGIYSRNLQFYSRLVLQILARRQRLEVGPFSLWLVAGFQGSSFPGFVRLALEPPASGIFQLASGSRGPGHGRLLPVLAPVRRVCVSPIRLDFSDPRPCQASRGFDPLDCPVLARSALVPGPAFPLCRDSLAPPRLSSSFEGSSGVPPSFDPGVAPAPSRMDNFRRSWQIPGLSPGASSLLGNSWAPRTHRSYQGAWRRWAGWCVSRQVDPSSAPLVEVLNYLSSLFASGLAYRSINVARSAIAAGHDPVAGVSVGKHSLVCRLLRGIRLARPPCPRYSALWDVSLVFRFLRAWPDNPLLSLKQLSAKLALLLCLISFRRVSDVRALDFNALSFTPEGVLFVVSRRTKSLSASIGYPAFPSDPALCVVRCLRTYLDRTSSLRSGSSSQLLISFVRPFRPVSTPSLARWIRWLLSLARVAPTFGAHSVRGAAASAAFCQGASLSAILRSADWASEDTFRRFYFRSSDHAALALLER